MICFKCVQRRATRWEALIVDYLIYNLICFDGVGLVRWMGPSPPEAKRVPRNISPFPGQKTTLQSTNIYWHFDFILHRTLIRCDALLRDIFEDVTLLAEASLPATIVCTRRNRRLTSRRTSQTALFILFVVSASIFDELLSNYENLYSLSQSSTGIHFPARFSLMYPSSQKHPAMQTSSQCSMKGTWQVAGQYVPHLSYFSFAPQVSKGMAGILLVKSVTSCPGTYPRKRHLFQRLQEQKSPTCLTRHKLLIFGHLSRPDNHSYI